MRGADKEMLARWQEETTDQKRNNTDRVVAGTGQSGVELESDTKIESRKKEKQQQQYLGWAVEGSRKMGWAESTLGWLAQARLEHVRAAKVQ